jgi:ribosome-binding protein aMBF1 (putative translation factor)
MDYTPAKNIIIGNPKLIAKKKAEEADKTSCNNGKCNFNMNASVSGKKIKDEDEMPQVEKVGIETGKLIMQARLAKNLKQTDLAKQLNVLPDIIRNYENGSAPRNGALLNKIGKHLGVKLTGKGL